MGEPDPQPLEERVITDFSALPPAYLEHLQRRMDEETERRAS